MITSSKFFDKTFIHQEQEAIMEQPQMVSPWIIKKFQYRHELIKQRKIIQSPLMSPQKQQIARKCPVMSIDNKLPVIHQSKKNTRRVVTQKPEDNTTRESSPEKIVQQFIRRRRQEGFYHRIKSKADNIVIERRETLQNRYVSLQPPLTKPLLAQSRQQTPHTSLSMKKVSFAYHPIDRHYNLQLQLLPL